VLATVEPSNSEMPTLKPAQAQQATNAVMVQPQEQPAGFVWPTADIASNMQSRQLSVAEWIYDGWQYSDQQRYKEALDAWQRGLNSMTDAQLLATLGAYSMLENAIEQLQQIGRDQKVFIVRSNMNGRDIYYVLSARQVPADIGERQVKLASLKKAAGITGKLLACESGKFKSTLTPRAPAAPDLLTASEPQSFTINRFDLSGNKLLSTDFILINLREYYGDGRTIRDIKRIKRDVINLYHMSGYSKVKVNLVQLALNETVTIQIDE